ncbi:hypothetical protein DNTS_024599 [Danionella cerebrum]|uniref:Uncharacterized protein n=1 Tax=Danionella cerebrum TaxID=2873325 RepID=A0A553NHI9_9TELE|nr:hypothetical protein DNTS_024599 [Danionella translucida]
MARYCTESGDEPFTERLLDNLKRPERNQREGETHGARRRSARDALREPESCFPVIPLLRIGGRERGVRVRERGRKRERERERDQGRRSAESESAPQREREKGSAEFIRHRSGSACEARDAAREQAPGSHRAGADVHGTHAIWTNQDRIRQQICVIKDEHVKRSACVNVALGSQRSCMLTPHVCTSKSQTDSAKPINYRRVALFIFSSRRFMGR